MRLSVGQHVLDLAVVRRVHKLSNLFPGQPLEVCDVEEVGGQVCLTSHDARLEEEGLLTKVLGAGLFVDLGFDAANRVAEWVIANHPSVHVSASGLGKGAFGGLISTKISMDSLSAGVY